MTEKPVAIIGGGIAGLAAALTLREHLPPSQVVLLEKDRRLGGKIQTEYTGGFVIEGGPDSFLSTKPGAVELCRELGLSDRLVGTLPAAHRSYVRRQGRLYELPEGLSGLIPSEVAPLLRSPLLSLRGRARAGLDLWIAPRQDPGEESIAGFVRRRLGNEAYDWLVEPLLSGIYAGDGTALSLDATFPQLREVERVHGSLIRGIARQKRPTAPEASPFLTPRAGLAEIVTALESRLTDCHVVTGRVVAAIERDEDDYLIRFRDGGTLAARGIVLATPAFVSARLVAELDDRLSRRLDGFSFVSTTTVSLAFPADALLRPLRGYGYLHPRAEGGPIVACTWVSSKWPGRAPEGQVLIRAFIGRSGHEDACTWPEEDLVALVRRELREVVGLTAAPSLVRVHRWPKGMPQYTLGHAERLARTEALLAEHPGLALAGHSYHGIGLPDCIRSGQRAAGRVLDAERVVG